LQGSAGLTQLFQLVGFLLTEHFDQPEN
jgi:hypothetical protein